MKYPVSLSGATTVCFVEGVHVAHACNGASTILTLLHPSLDDPLIHAMRGPDLCTPNIHHRQHQLPVYAVEQLYSARKP
jgi:hypothetical protein